MKGGLLPRSPAVEVLRALRSAVDYQLALPRRAESHCATPATYLHALPLSRPVSWPYGVFILLSYIRYTLARDCISLLDNATGHYVKTTILTNVWPLEMQTGLRYRFSRSLSPQVKWDGDFYWPSHVKFSALTFKKENNLIFRFRKIWKAWTREAKCDLYGQRLKILIAFIEFLYLWIRSFYRSSLPSTI